MMEYLNQLIYHETQITITLLIPVADPEDSSQYVRIIVFNPSLEYLDHFFVLRMVTE